MEEATQKKGMSKGCLIGLIVAIVIVVMVIIAGVVVYLNWDQIMAFTGKSVVVEVKKTFAAQPPDGVDTTAFNSLSDAFSEKMESAPLETQQYAKFFNDAKAAIDDGRIDSVEAERLIDDMIECYPDLEDMYVPPEMPEELDSTMVEELEESEE